MEKNRGARPPASVTALRRSPIFLLTLNRAIDLPVLPHAWICSSSVKSGWGREERPSAEIGMGEGGKA